MTVTSRTLLAAVLCTVLATPAEGQSDDVTLSLHSTTERQLSPNAQHGYRVALDANQFLFVTVAQKGIDVVVDVVDPEGTRISVIDSPTGASGTEFVLITTEMRGDYRLVVRPFDAEADRGSYEIAVERIEAAATSKTGRVNQILSPWSRADSPGAAVAVARGGKLLHSGGYGYANLEYEVPITRETVFHVASVSKQFVAYAVTMLADQGRLSLDDDVRKHVPEVPDFGETITLRHLIHHTSGLRDQWNLLVMAGWRMDDVITTDQILRLVSWQRELNFSPGDEYLYCNTGYTLLAEVVSRVTGQSFNEWMKTNVFESLAMVNSHFHDDHQMIVPNRAYSYTNAPSGGFQKSVLNYATVGATSLFTTAEDLTKWIANLASGTVGGPDVARQVRERGVLNNGDTLTYAYGLGIGTHRGLDVVGHGGADAGFRSSLQWFPESGLAVAVVSNLATFSPGNISDRIADIFLEEEFPSVAEDAASEVSAPQPADVAITILQDYLGYYRLPTTTIAEVQLDSTGLLWRIGSNVTQLRPTSDSTFVSRNQTLTFRRDEGRDVTILLVGDQIARRVQPYDESRTPLSEYAGNYSSDELRTSYRLHVRDGQLVAEHQRNVDAMLRPVVQDGFAASRFHLGTVEFTRDDNGNVDGFLSSNGRVRRLRFRKEL